MLKKSLGKEFPFSQILAVWLSLLREDVIADSSFISVDFSNMFILANSSLPPYLPVLYYYSSFLLANASFCRNVMSGKMSR